MQLPKPDYYIPPYPWDELGGLQAVSTPAVGNWPIANTAIYVPIIFSEEITLSHITFYAANATGNFDLGFYNESFTKLFSTGSTVMSAGIKSLSLSSYQVVPGKLYYGALVLSSATGQTLRATISVTAYGPALGLAVQTSALPLPGTATPETYTSTSIPFFVFRVL